MGQGHDAKSRWDLGFRLADTGCQLGHDEVARCGLCGSNGEGDDDGIVVGEACCFLLLEEEHHQQQTTTNRARRRVFLKVVIILCVIWVRCAALVGKTHRQRTPGSGTFSAASSSASLLQTKERKKDSQSVQRCMSFGNAK